MTVASGDIEPLNLWPLSGQRRASVADAAARRRSLLAERGVAGGFFQPAESRAGGLKLARGVAVSRLFVISEDLAAAVGMLRPLTFSGCSPVNPRGILRCQREKRAHALTAQKLKLCEWCMCALC